jgi:16S rRNA (uracil1498-N3)-methyltransferase
MSRLFVEMSLKVGEEILLPKESTHYLLNVLRLRVGTSLILFNGQGGEYVAHLVAATKKSATLQLIEYQGIERESNLPLTLVQAISRPEHFSYTLQKAVELGVQHIVPVITERSPPVDKSKISKREQHWRKIIISACEQCGRNRLPQLHEVLSLKAWLSQPQPGLSLVLSPTGNKHLLELESKALALNEFKRDSITVLIGAEGGLTEAEIEQAKTAGYQDIRFGSRILRTETAATAILAVCQTLWGDLAL